SNFTRHPEGVTLHAEGASAEVRAVADGIFRVRVVTDPADLANEPFSYAVGEGLQAPSNEFDDDSLTLRADGWRAAATRAPLRVAFKSPDGHIFAADSFGPGFLQGRFHVWKQAHPEARFYGLGEKAYPLDRTGRAFTNWNTDAPGYQAESDPLYKTFPFFLCVE